MKKHTSFHRIFPALSSCALLGLLAAVPACSSTDNGTADSGAGGAAPPTFTEVYTTVLAPLCSGCHVGGAAASGNLDMSTQTLAYTNLVGKAAMGPLCVSSNATRVVANQPSQSLIINKLTMMTPLCGSQMPLGGGMLTTAQIALVTDWITDGALNN